MSIAVEDYENWREIMFRVLIILVVTFFSTNTFSQELGIDYKIVIKSLEDHFNLVKKNTPVVIEHHCYGMLQVQTYCPMEIYLNNSNDSENKIAHIAFWLDEKSKKLDAVTCNIGINEKFNVSQICIWPLLIASYANFGKVENGKFNLKSQEKLNGFVELEKLLASHISQYEANPNETKREIIYPIQSPKIKIAFFGVSPEDSPTVSIMRYGPIKE